ncbi:Hybrid signal transduction histidine kinase B [Lachnellula occidentalis]|uniref:histidine kinase n=1 Tax=Lachnellula occidentalis TaxID=215460 RepID=A0A8H8S1R0_9HELO|nr:Hybrid signal transduction histidine kinase B [Lachnellula occidentalis]
MASAGTFRAREVYRYYQPTSLADATDPSTSSNTNPNGLTTLQSFSDTALTAFAQLIAIRLSAQRAVVSLADHENEYFLAESTSSLSQLDDGPTQNAWMSISGARVPLEASLSERTLRLAPNLDSNVEMSPVLFIPDLRLDENMSKLECVERAPHLRFYCGVPLTNLKGVNIGCVYVVDDKPRSEFSPEQAQFLNTMAATIMDHLENIRAKEEVTRVTKMSQALHAFIEGDGTMEGDWQRLKRYDLPSGAGVAFHWESHNEGGKKPEVVLSNHTRTQNQTPSDVSDSGPTSPGLSPLQHTTGSQDARFNYNNSPWGSSTASPGLPETRPDVAESGVVAPKTNRGMDAEFSTDGFSNLLHGTFSRASNLVREGMEVDGAVFFDAPFRFYQGRSNLQPDTRRSDPYGTGKSTESNDDGPPNIRPGPRPYSRPSHHQSAAEDEILGLPETADLEQVKSDILGYSTAGSSSWNNKGTKEHPSFASINQSLLTSLVKRYPNGELFVFDENGPTLPLPASPTRDSQEISHKTITSATAEKQAQDDSRQTLELQSLLASFPGSRQIFFVPLYDSTSGCFIGSFAWSTSATRIFSVENHLGYLIAFGHSLMSEITKLNTLSADHAKGDFISNVSHELRSPLHGVLASVEFLADTTLDGFQRNLVQTIDICGRTLLDTIEHVLDFSKIKKFGQDSMQSMGILADLDVSAVIEEVLEGVFAGFEFNGLSSLGLADMTKSHSQGALPTQRTFREPPTIIIDMGFRERWKFPTVPGTWRRLTMNLFGNALKYTPSGYIRVKLEAQSIPSVEGEKKANLPERTLVTLTVTDSGQGMSSDFMKTKLFMPFSQEDVTAPGTGLGLSIVKEIVDLAGGSIDVRSELGRGTEITLSLPLENCPVGPSKTSADTENINPGGLLEGIDEPVTAVRRRGRGRTITIRGFGVIPGSSKLQTASLSGLKASIENYITDWFQLTIASDDAAADILICDESALVHSSATELKCQALLILCSNSARRDIYTSNLDASQVIEVIGKPCGPHRLAKALLNCFDAEDAMTLTNTQRITAVDEIEAAKMTVNTSKSLTLIGNLQSSIGFSPTTTLSRTPTIDHNITKNLKRRQETWNQAPEAKKISLEKEGSSRTAAPVDGASGPSLDPSIRTRQLKNYLDPGPRVPAPIKINPAQIPNRFLLVEVREESFSQ